MGKLGKRSLLGTAIRFLGLTTGQVPRLMRAWPRAMTWRPDKGPPGSGSLVCYFFETSQLQPSPELKCCNDGLSILSCIIIIRIHEIQLLIQLYSNNM